MLSTTVLFPVIEVHELGKHNLLTLGTMSLHANLKDGFAHHLKDLLVEIRKVIAPFTERKSGEGEVTSGTRHSIELQLKRLEALFKFTLEVATSHGICFVMLKITSIEILLESIIVSLSGIREKRLVNTRDGEPTELLCCSNERDVTDNLKRTEYTGRFRVVHIGHTESTLKDITHVEQTAIDAVEDHISKIVDIDRTFLRSLEFFLVQIELFVQFLRKVSLDERTLRTDKRRIKVSILPISEKKNSVRIILHLFKGLGIRVLVVSELLVCVTNSLVVASVQRLDYDVVHLRRRNVLALGLTFESDVRFQKLMVTPTDVAVSTLTSLVDSLENLFNIERFYSAILLNYLNHVSP